MSRHLPMRHRILVAGATILLLLLAFAAPLVAATFRSDDTVTIGQNEVIDDDLIVAANTVVVDGIVRGDLVAVGSQLIINGQVEGSTVFAGQQIILNGEVNGTVYGAGTALTLNSGAEIGRNLFYAGYSIVAERESYVGHDLIVAAYQAMLRGVVERNVFATLGALELDGRVGGDVQVVVGQPDDSFAPQFFVGVSGQPLPQAIPPGLRLSPEAVISGQLRYTSPVDQSGSIATRPDGGVVFTTSPLPSTAPVETPSNRILDWSLTRLRSIVTLLVIGALLLWLMPNYVRESGEQLQSHPWLSGAWGFLVMLVGHAGALLLLLLIIVVTAGFAAMTLGALATAFFVLFFGTLALAFILFALLILYVSKVVVLVTIGQRLLMRVFSGLENTAWLALLFGAVTYGLLVSVPWLGLLLNLVITFLGLGSIWLTVRDHYCRHTPATPKLVLTPA